jgi:hypothetical protein
MKIPNLTYAGKASLVEDNQVLVESRYVYPLGTNPEREQSYAIVKGMYLTKGRTLEREKNIKIGGIEARMFVITDDTAMAVLEIRTFVVQNELYIFIYERPFAGEPSEESREFFEGIKIGPDQSTDPIPSSGTPAAGQPARQP